MSKKLTMESVLLEFIQAVEDTGGVVKVRKGFVAPAADPEWGDIGAIYLDACKAVGRKPYYRSADTLKCPACDEWFGPKDFDGGRCLSCGSMIV
jgi:hypothetical protein